MFSDAFRSERDWTEDFAFENGKYLNTCLECRRHFMGYKRRVICRLCAVPFIAPAPEVRDER
jgi:hypothetical protein